MSSFLWESLVRHPIGYLAFKLIFSVFLALGLVQAVFWALADIHYREFGKTYQQLLVSTSGSLEFKDLALKADAQIQRSISLAGSNAVYRRARGQLDRHYQSVGINRTDLPHLKTDARAAFMAAAQRSPTWELPYIDLAQLCLEQTPLSFETYALKCRPLFQAAVELDPTYAYPHEQWANSLAMVLGRQRQPSPGNISRMCGEFGRALDLNWSGDSWNRAFIACSALTREYRFLRLLNPRTSSEWSNVVNSLAQDNVDLWHQAKNDILADLERKNYPLAIYLAIVKTLAKLGFARQGEWVLTHYLAANPRDAKAWNALINLAETRGPDGQREEIKEMVAQALASADYDASAWLYFARILYENGDNKYSTEVFRQVLAKNPLSSDAYLELGDLLSKSELWKGAGLAYQKAVDLQPNNMSAWVRLGTNLAKQGEFQLAVQKLEEALSLNPNNTEIKRALRRIGVY